MTLTYLANPVNDASESKVEEFKKLLDEVDEAHNGCWMQTGRTWNGWEEQESGDDTRYVHEDGTVLDNMPKGFKC